MPSLPRLLVCAGCLTVMLIAPAMAVDDTIYELRRITKEAGKELEQIKALIRELEYRARSSSPTNAGASNRGFNGTQFGIIDLQRSARRVAQLGSEANSRLSKCDKSVREISRAFQAETRTISNLAGRISDTRGNMGAEMSFGQIDFAVQRAYQVLPALASIDSCEVGDGTGPADGEESEGDKVKKKNDKGTEDYDE